MKKIVVTKDQIVDLYITQNLTKKVVADKLNMSTTTLNKFMKDFNIIKDEDLIHIEKTSHRKQVDIQEICRLYIDEKMSIKKIAERFVIGGRRVEEILTNNGVTLRPKRGDRIQKEDLYNYYIVENHSLEESYKYFDVSKSSLQLYIKKYNLHKPEELRLGKIEKTMLERYGVEHALQSNEFIEKYKKSMLEKPEEELREMKDKRKKTCLEKYGCVNPMQNKDVQEKSKQTCLEKYGVDHHLKSPEFRKKIEGIVMDKYGVTNVLYLPEVQAKKQKTIKEKYGVDNYGELDLSQEVRDLLNSKDKLVEFIEKSDNKSSAYLAKKIGCSFSTFNNRINQYDIRYLIDQTSSVYEAELSDFLDAIGVKHYKSRDVIPPLEIDFYCPDYKIGIEFNGDYYHCSICKNKSYHFNKSKDCQKKGIKLIHIWEHEWVDENKRDILKSMLKILFGKVENKIYARNCEVREITNDEARDFNEKNHLQGHRWAQLTYGLFYNDKLVQLMSFSKTKYNKNLKGENSWEIIRGCPGSNNIVVGGVSKLFNHFIKEKSPDEIFSYCDFNKFDGKGYEAIGMKFVGYTGPDMKWLLDDRTVVNRDPTHHAELKEKAIAKIWGCGSKKYLWTNPNK